MKFIVRVELITDWGETTTTEAGEIDRPRQSLKPSAYRWTTVKRLLHSLQQVVIRAQTDEFCALRRVCQSGHRWTALKDYRQRKVDTVESGKIGG